MKDALKTYPAPWENKPLLACRKCQKKLKSGGSDSSLAKFKKAIKRYNKAHQDHALHVINVQCMDLCPKNGVVICDPGNVPSRLSILWSESDLESLFGPD